MNFARLAKLLAVLLVGIALWRARPPAAPAHVIVLALPGASMDLAVTGAARDAAVSFGGPILVPPATSGAAFWRRIVAADAPADVVELVPMWSGTKAPVRAIAAPARLFGAQKSAVSAESAFLGSSAGAIVEAADITSGRLPAPYDRAADAISSAAATLRREEWSEWIRVEPLPPAPQVIPAVPVAAAREPLAAAAGNRFAAPAHAASAAKETAPAAQFQFARATDTSYFFSPAYIIGADGTIGTPFLRGIDRDLRPLIAAHVIALSRRRLDASRTLLAPQGDLRPVFVFDSIGEDATSVFRPDSTPGATLDQVRDAIVAELAVLRRAVGADGLLVVIGGPPTSRETGTPAWFRIIAASGGSGGDPETTTLEFDAARALIRYVAGLSLDRSEKALVPAALTGRFPIRATAPKPAADSEPDPPEQHWSVEALESVPGAVGSNR